MKLPFLLLLLAAQNLCAGLQRYSELVVADSSSSSRPHDALRITYLGTNGYQFESGQHVLFVDPYFSRIDLTRVALRSRIQPDLRRIDDAMQHLKPKVDAIVVTHGHVDHLLDVPVLMKRTGARLLGSRTSGELARRAGAPPALCDTVEPGVVHRIGPWKITAFAAIHDRVFLIGVPFPGEPKGAGPPQTAADWVCGEPLAYLIEAAGQRIFIDSGGTRAALPPGSIAPVDLAILGAALPDSRARFSEAVQRLRPRYVLPSHQDDFFRSLSAGFVFGPLTDFPRVLRDYQRDRLPGRLVLLDYFEPWTLPQK
jgi:L-ascorbate metabolism protein UlaG (beta-lactamase superfamily)